MRKKLLKQQFLLVLLTMLIAIPQGVWAEDYPITVAGVPVTDANASGITGDNITGTVTFTPADNTTSPATPATLTLNGATILGTIQWSENADFTVNLIGSNSISTTMQGSPCISSGYSKTISFTRGDTSEPCSLSLSSDATTNVFYNFSNVSSPTVTDLYWIPDEYWRETINSATITSSFLSKGGDGSESSPFLISTASELVSFATLYNTDQLSRSCYVKLGNDIVFNDESFVPIGTPQKPFIGTFNGRKSDNSGNYKISYLSYDATGISDYAGLFLKVGVDGDVPAPGYVSNLTLENCTFENGNMNNGAIAGILNKGTIDNCTVTSCNILSETSAPSSGGIVGEQLGGSITNCIVSGSTIAATSTTGGLAGGIVANIAGTATISGCQVTGTDEKPTTITCSSNYNDSGSNCTGGIVGNCSYFNYDVISISNNKVSGNTTISSIDNYGDPDGEGNTCAGAIVGDKGNASFSNNYYYYTVTTSTKNGEAAAVTRNGYMQRGTGTENTVVAGSYDLTDNDGAVLYTKKLTIAHEHIKEGYKPADWHKGFSTDGGVFRLIPSQQTTVTLEPDDYYTITAATLSYGTTPTVDNLNGVVEDGVYSYTFTMPEDDATLTPTIEIPGYFGLTVAGTPVTETNASNVLSDVHASVSYSDGTLTLKGIKIGPSSEDVIIIDEEVEALTVHLVGYNQIDASDHSAFNLKGNTALTFTTSDKMPGSLVSNGNVLNEGQQPSVTYQNGLALNSENKEIKAGTGAMTVTALTGSGYYLNSDNNGTAYMYSQPFSFEATKADMIDNNAVIVSTPDNTTATELWTSLAQPANVLKFTVQFDWGTCTNKNVTVQVVGYNQNEQTYDWEADGETYSSDIALSTADADGIIEIPITKDVTSSQLRLRFSSDAAFSFVALSVGITEIENYPLTIGETQVTSKNASDVLGDDKISYDVKTNTLTLNGATVGEDGSNPEPTIPEAPGLSYSGTDDLTISLIGSNTIYGMGGCDAIRYSGEPGDNHPKLIFAKGDNQPCSLQLSAIETTVISSGFSQINGVNGINDTYAEALTLIFNKEVSYGSESDGLYYYHEEVSYPVTSAVITSGYGLTVGDVMVYEGNAADILDGDETNDGKVSYNATTNTLKLDGADLSGNGISYEGAEDLTIALKGNSQVFSISYTNNEAEDIPQLLFTKAEGATDCTLALNSKGDGSVIDGFSDVDYGTFNTMSSDPLKYGNMTPEEDYICLLDAITNDFMPELTITTATTYPLWVGGTQVTGTSVIADNIQRCENYVDNEEYGITFTPGETNTLNLLRSGITIEESRKPAIVSSLDNLTIQLEGINNIIFNGEYSYYMIVSTDANATLTFKAVGDDAMLNANISESDYIGSPANGFKTVSYEDDLVYIANGTSTQTIKRIPAITFTGSNLWATYYSTDNLAVPEGLTAYVVSAVDEENGEVTATQIGYIPANNAVLLKRTDTATETYTAAAYTGTTGTVNNLLSGSTQETAVSSIANSPVYVLFNDKFKRATSGTIPARRAYLALGAAVAPSGAPRFMNISIGDGSVTAIKTVAVDDNSNDSWYTIDGLKLNGKPQRKGLYINKGKKMYINNNK